MKWPFLDTGSPGWLSYRHRTHIHVTQEETSYFDSWIFRIKWSLEANLVGRIRILFIVTFGNSECRLSGHFRRFKTVRLNRPIGISCEVILNLDRDIQVEPPNRRWHHIKLPADKYCLSGEWWWVLGYFWSASGKLCGACLVMGSILFKQAWVIWSESRMVLGRGSVGQWSWWGGLV
jgi:hypothetical protein